MRILTLTSSFPRKPKDTAGMFLLELSRWFVAKGVEVLVLAPHDKGSKLLEIMGKINIYRFLYFLPPSLEKLAYGSGVIKNMNKNKILYFQLPFFVFFEFVWGLVIAVVRRPQIIHAHWSLPQGLIALVIKIILRTPYIVSIHGSDVFALGGSIVGSINKIVIRKADLITVNSLATKKEIKKLAPNTPTTIVPMGVDPKKFQSVKKKVNNDNTKRIVFIGRLIDWKGVNYLISAMPEIVKENDAVELIIIGEGQESSHLKNLSKELKVDNHINFLGNIEHSKLRGYLSNADAFVLPSIITKTGETEGLGVVLLEAMASGVPVIGSNVGGIPTIIKHLKTGILVKPGNEKEITKAVNDVLSNKHLRKTLIDNGNLLIKKTYSWDTISEQFIELFTNIVEEKQSEIKPKS